MFSKGFPALLGRLGSVALLFVATSAAFSSLAFADYVVPALKTDWIYFDLNLQGSTPCMSTDIAMANYQIAQTNHCEAVFSHWTAPGRMVRESRLGHTSAPRPVFRRTRGTGNA